MEANKKIRCVNTKTNEVRWISANVANNAGFRKKYKWQIEELPAAKEEPKQVQLPEPKEPETDPISQEEEFPDIPAVVNIDEVKPVEQPQEEKKARKPRTQNKKKNN